MGFVTISEIDPPIDISMSSVLQRHHDWFAFAVCRDDRSLFFAAPGERPERRERREAQAKRICATCPVRAVCRDTGREQHEHGVWGGETEAERAALGFLPRRASRRPATAQD